MKQDIQLYINDKLVDFTDELNMPFTYQLKDINNPSIIKNPFTKTINIIGSPNNNKIFGEIYKLDREQIYSNNILTGSFFNPSIRTPFTMYKNGDVIESGYMQLNSISIIDLKISYNITLYGGIGNFFYSLMYNKNNEPLKLSSLIYGVEGGNGNPDDELTFNITKDFVMENWMRLGAENYNTIFDYITFIPSYNGLPQNFDSNKVVVYDSAEDDYKLVEMSKKLTEWEMKDLRSYLQRPALKMSKLISACQNPINNGGYDVILDEDFFNDDNPYFTDSWIALPLLTSVELEKNNIVSSDFSICTQYMCQNNKVFEITNEQVTIDDALVPLNTTAFPLTTDGKGIDCSNWEKGTLTDIDINLNLSFYTDTLVQGEIANFYTVYNGKKIVAPLIIKFEIKNGNDEIINYKEYTLTTLNLPFLPEIENSGINFDFPKQNINGYFEYVGKDTATGKNKFVFINKNGDNTINLTLNNIPYTEEIYINFKVERVLVEDYFEGGTLYDSFGRILRGYFLGDFQNSTIKKDRPDTTFSTGSKITKNELLKTEKTPADYLLSYCKLFNLFFTIDESKKTVKIMTMNNYFNGNIVDISDKIDISKEMSIKPLVYDNKFYCLSFEDGENHYLNKYKTNYTVNFGQKRINTNYNFNNETKQLLEGNVFKNTVSASDTSQFYSTFKINGITQPPYYINNSKITSKYKNGTVTKLEEDVILTEIPNITYWNKNGGYDAFPKNCFYMIENDEKSLNDISSTLLFYNGKVTPKDLNGEELNYYLSDDNEAMYILNDRVACYFYDENFNETIPLNSINGGIPQFLRYKIFANNITSSFDLGKPKEIYIPNVTYDEDTTLYNQFWSNYFNDTLDINTKEVTCYVNLNDMVVNGNLLRNFYYFNGCYWLLNKIENYNINNFDTTKCTFIKINDISNYKNY